MDKKTETKESIKALRYAVARAIAPYIAQIPGAFEVSAAEEWDGSWYRRRLVYRRCGDFGEPDAWARNPDTGAAFCANGSEPYPMADDAVIDPLFNIMLGAIRSMLWKYAVYQSKRDFLAGTLESFAFEVDFPGLGMFYIRSKHRRRWKNPKNGKYYRHQRSVELGLARVVGDNWLHDDTCNCGG